MYIDPQKTPVPLRPTSAGSEPDRDQIRLRDLEDDRSPTDRDDEQDFECVCHIHVETRDGRTFYRLVLERE